MVPEAPKIPMFMLFSSGGNLGACRTSRSLIILIQMFNLIDLRRVDLNLLVVFETVFRERSVKRAAARLFVGQSAVSMALSRLRELFEDELFVKVATGVEPTTK